MPGFDKTGPGGQGPMTGRGQGNCVDSRDSARPRLGGFGSFGRRWRNRFFNSGMPGRFWGRGFAREESALSSQDEVAMLQEEASYFEKELKSIREELNRLKKNDKKEIT